MGRDSEGRPTVFPTPVGVFPGLRRTRFGRLGLPHARGGVSVRLSRPAFQQVSSPRPWGCFYRHVYLYDSLFVFPTPVGVFLWIGRISGHNLGLPHARGGVSNDS